MRIHHQNTEKFTDINISKGATSNEEMQYLYESPTIGGKIKKQDKISFVYKAQSLFEIQDFYFSIQFVDSTIVFNAPKQYRRYYDSDDIVPLKEQKFPCGLNKIKRIKASFSAKDQGYGNRKGEVYLCVMPHKGERQYISLTDGPVEHEYQNYTFDSS